MATSREREHKKDSTRGTSAKTSGAGIGMATGGARPTGSSHAPKAAQMSNEVRMRAESDMGTLHRAHQIMTDKPRHAAAQAHAAEVFAAASAPGVSVSKKGKA